MPRVNEPGTSAGDHSPAAQASAKAPLVIDLDATLINVHSEKERPHRRSNTGSGYHPLCAFLDHGQAGTGEPLAIALRPGDAGSNTASDHITVTRQALARSHQPCVPGTGGARRRS